MKFSLTTVDVNISKMQINNYPEKCTLDSGLFNTTVGHEAYFRSLPVPRIKRDNAVSE